MSDSGQTAPPSRVPSGLRSVLIATASAGIAALLIQTLVGASISPAEYAVFAVFWAALYLIVGGLSGVQQEIVRASHVDVDPVRRSASASPAVFATGSAVVVFAVLLLTGLGWGPLVFGANWFEAVLFLSLGGAFAVCVAIATGTLYGAKRWGILAASIVADPGLRLVAVALALLAGGSVLQLHAAVVVSFPLVLLLIVVFRTRSHGAPVTLDVGYRRLVWNASRTLVGAVATSALVSGFPLFLGISAQDESQKALGTLLFVLTLTRAPIVIPLLALQSFLILTFSEAGSRLWAVLMRLLAAVAGGTLVLAVLAALLAPWILEVAFGGKYEIAGTSVGLIVMSAGATAALCASGAATIARAQHTAFLAGWVVAAVITIGLVFVPLDLTARTVVALSIGPLIGLAVHLVLLAAPGRSGRSRRPR
jgi:O-antigen/teichoic acid export membrane protein